MTNPTSGARFKIVMLIMVLASNLSSTPASSAAEALKATFVPPALSSTIALDSPMQFTFNFTGGVAAKLVDCNDLRGLRISLSVSDADGNVATYPWLQSSVEGLWSGYGWTSKVLPNGLQCAWDYDAKNFLDLIQATQENGDWYFEQSQFDGNRTSGRLKATKLLFSWDSNEGNYQSGSGAIQNIVGQSGAWQIRLKGSLVPQVSFTGLERGVNITLPLTVKVLATGSTTMPVTEFNFGPSDEYLLWEKSTAQGQQGQWKRTKVGNCTNPTAQSVSEGKVSYSATCTYIPRDNFQNKSFRATAYTSDHRPFFSDDVIVSTEIMKGFESPKGTITLKKDAKGVPYRAILSGELLSIPVGLQIYMCLVGNDPSNSAEDTKDCKQFKVSDSRKFSYEFNLPAKYFLSATVAVDAPYGFDTNLSPVTTFAYEENATYECQNHLSGCLTKSQKASLNKSKYSEGYSLINASPSSLKSAGFYSYFSASKKMTKVNASKFCQSYFRTATLRTDYFDGWGSTAISTFLQGCTAAAMKIPYGK